MKTTFLFTGILVCCFLQLFAQNPLVGTWEVVSIKGTSSDGTKISADGSEFKETKIITPTHYFLFTQRKQGDSLVFDKAIAGTIRVQGNKYIEMPIYYSDEVQGKIKTDFTYRLEGDKFIQAGTYTTADGKVATLGEIVFKKVKETTTSNPAIGTWNQLSSSGKDAEGKDWSYTNATHIRLQTITPTHWMRISYKDNKFENAMGGTYRMEGNKVYPNFEMLSFPAPEGLKVELTQRVEGNKMYWSGSIHQVEGKRTFEDVFEKVDSKTAKTASTK